MILDGFPSLTKTYLFMSGTTAPENAHLKLDLEAFYHHEMTLTLNTHIHSLTSLVVCICQVSGLSLQ